ncbi:MAG: PEP-CTERM sorting domain-containing protein [Pirellulaceae bacterium]
MKTRFVLLTIIFGALIAGFANPSTGFAAAFQTDQGTDGVDGADGANGNPGEDGEAGGNGDAGNVSVNGSSDVNATAMGGKGGNGGAGGNGIGAFADGGLGGNGGTGGLATVSVSTTGNAFGEAIGGLGGNGGVGGIALSTGIDGFGGFGGYGGSAVANVTGGSSAIAIARGGQSGPSGGTPFSNSFRGGNVSATAHAMNSSGDAFVSAQQYGGNGGISGGRGANSNMTNRVGGGSATTLTADQISVAGHGGNGIEGVGGDGGIAVSNINQSMFNSLGGNANLTLNAVGGNAGFSQDVAYRAGVGGNAQMGATLGGNGNINVVASAIAGNGGDHLTGHQSGNGGRASMAYSNLTTNSDKNITFLGTLVGGNGGNAKLNAALNQSKGGDAYSVNALSVAGQANDVSLTLDLTGGNAGNFGHVDNLDRYVGLAGRATGRIGDTSNVNNKVISITSQGGVGANFVLPEPPEEGEVAPDWAGGNGGAALAQSYSANNLGDTTINLNAFGGDIGNGGQQLINPLGFLGFGGTAFASGYGETTSASGNVEVTSTAIGGLGLGNTVVNGGGSAKSYATAVGHNANNAYANTLAKTQNSSDGTVSSSIAKSNGANANAVANSDGTTQFGSTLDVLGSSANANSYSEAWNGNATSSSTGLAGNLATSITSSIAKGFEAQSESIAFGGESVWSLNGIRAGNASAFSTAISGDGVSTISEASATGGNSMSTEDVWGIGGNAKAVSRAVSTNATANNMTSNATAVAGLGQASSVRPGRDGFATAIARGESTAADGMGTSTAIANSTWKATSQASMTNGAVSKSEAKIVGGASGQVLSTAYSFNENAAISSAKSAMEGPSSTLGDARGTVYSMANTEGIGVHHATSTITATVDASVDSAAKFGGAHAASGHHQSSNQLGIMPTGSEIIGYQELFPESAFSADFLSTGGLSGTFASSTDIYGMGILGHEAGMQGTYATRLDVSLDVDGTDDLLLGFFDNNATADGFNAVRMVVSVEGNVILDERAGNLTEADGLFNDHVYSLGSLTSIDGPLDLKIEWFSNMLATDGFTTRFVFGNGSIPMVGSFNAVPEPGTMGIMGLSLLALAFRRRRK